MVEAVECEIFRLIELLGICVDAVTKERGNLSDQQLLKQAVK